MNTKLNLYDCLKDNKIAFVRVNDKFKSKLKEKIILKYGSLGNYAKTINTNKNTLAVEFRINKFMKFNRLIQMADDLEIDKNYVYNQIESFYAKGSKSAKEIILPQNIVIDEQFVEGYALYFAEGDNGSNGKTIPRKVRLTNSDIFVHKLFVDWINKYFPKNYFLVKILVPDNKKLTKEHYSHVKHTLNLRDNQIKTQTVIWKRRTDFIYRTCLDSAIIIDIILAIENKVKEISSKDKSLGFAYIRGMMIGEGTVHLNRSRYVRIEMKNEKEIKFIHNILTKYGYNCKPSLRTTRQDMWSIYIGAKQLQRFSKEIGFGAHKKRQNLLEKAANKQLRVNQYG